jgi:hypothetical protein
MSVSNDQLRSEFAKYDLMLIKEFANLILPLPRSQKHQIFQIKTADGFTFFVWGKDAADVLNMLHRFLGLRAFI